MRSEARDAFRVYRSTYDIAGHYQREVLPLREIISDEMKLRFSSMQVDVFALLTEARQRIAALRAAIDAKRDFWLAQSELKTAVNGGGGGGSSTQDNPSLANRAGGRWRTLNGESHVIPTKFPWHGNGARKRNGDQRPRPGRKHPRSADHGEGDDAAAALSLERAGLPAGRDAQRLDAAVAHERRLEGIPSRRRAGRTRVRARA